MTKRWERELRRLDDVDAPTERIRAHAADRPTDPSHGDGLPPRRQRITAGVVAVVVFVAAGTFAWQAFRPSDQPPAIGGVDTDNALVVTLRSPAETQGEIAFPTATFSLGGQSTDIATQSVDGWPDIPDDVGFDDPLYSLGFDVPAGTALVVEGDASSASATVRDDVAIDTATFVDLDLSDGGGTLPTDVGQHVIDLTGTWPDGTASFTAAFRIVPAAPVGGTQAVLSFIGKNAPEGTLAFGGNDQSGTQSEYTWCDGSGGCVNGISDFATYPPVSKFIEIPVGTSLTLDGTVPSIKGVFRTLQGEKASPTIEDPSHLGTVPTEAGRYELELHVALDGENNEHGSATFWFGVDAIEAENPSGQQVSDALHVECTSSGTLISEATVAAQHDGVHLEVDDSSAVAGAIHIDWAEQGTFRDSIGVGTNDVILSIPPGSASVTCMPVDEKDVNRSASFEVLDPEGRFQSPALGCETSSRQEAVLDAHSPEGAGHEMWDRLKGILDSDVVKPEGYAARPDWENSVFWGIVLREREPVASLRIYYSGTLEVLTCPGADISIDGGS